MKKRGPYRKRLGGRPKRTHPIAPETARKMIRRMHLGYALMIFGPYRTAEEMMRRDKERGDCDRKEALEKAAKFVCLDPNRLNNWLRRPKQYRERSY
jgi:hypothetical protein